MKQRKAKLTTEQLDALRARAEANSARCNRLTAEQRHELVAAYAAGATGTELSRRFNIGQQSVSYLIKRALKTGEA